MCKKPDLPVITKAEIKKRCELGEALVIFDDMVLNLTRFMKFHPGGEMPIRHLIGQDATDAMIAYHSDFVLDRKVKNYCIGVIPASEQTTTQISRDYRILERRLKEEGLFETNYNFYYRELLKFGITWCLMAYFAVYGGGNVFSYLFSSLCCAFLWHQVAFVAHDSGHTSITHVKIIDDSIGIFLAGCLGGLSIGWWKKNHNVHHIVTNSPENDPDIQHLPFFAVSTCFFDDITSSYYNRTLKFDSAAKVFVSLQHYLFYAVLSLGRFNLYALSWIYLLGKNVPYRKAEMFAICCFWTWYIWMLSHIPTWPMTIAYILISHMATFILHVQITISHFGMPTDEVENEEFAAKALRTSMDVECHPWMDWFHGGLHFQVAHHLYPRVPRCNLRKLTPLCKEFAAKNGIKYHGYPFFEANGVVLGSMRKVAEQVFLPRKE